MRWSSCYIGLLLLSIGIHFASSKELVLADEWQTIGENETLPAGAHIRIDMTTGVKMAKLMVPEDSSQNQASVEITSQGGSTGGGSALQIHSTVTDTTTTTTTTLNANNATLSVQEKIKEARSSYDYDMMYRTLSKLPIEEQQRMGLPQLPASTSQKTGMTADERVAFQQQMKQLWEQRQEEIARLQMELQMDMPELLKDRIERLKAYLQDPGKHLMELEQKRDSGDDQIEKGVVTHVESVLLDLEYQLADLDMTRDFHTLGGWHLLVSLLDDSVHQWNTNYTNLELVGRVQMNAAWAIGTAVKNTEEFYSYATETVQVQGKTTTPVSLIKELMDKTTESKIRHKLVYALGSMLRGNRAAQLLFLRVDGPTTLSRTLAQILETGDDVSLAKRIIALVGDVVSDIVLHADGHKSVIDAFSTTNFCQSTLDSLLHLSLRETSVRAMQHMAPFCDWDEREAIKALEEVTSTWEGDPGIDPDVRRELLDLASNATQSVTLKN